MRVYHPLGRVRHDLFVAPAADPRAAAGGVDTEWIDEHGDARTFHVNFVNGAATVPDNLGRYLCATKQAKRTRLWLPGQPLAA